MEDNQETASVDSSSSYTDTMYQLSHEILSNPLNVILLSISAFLLYKILVGRQAPKPRPELEVELPRMKKKDLTLEELKQYNGTGDGGRICIAVNGRIYDVTRGKTFYGPGGPYSIFAGRDASRALALFTVSESAFKTDDDDLSDLTLAEMNRMKEWQIQLEEKYDFVGRLLKPGQEPVDYTDSEEEQNDEGDEKEKETWTKPLEKEEKLETDDSNNANLKAEENVDDVDEKKEQEAEEKTQEKGKPEEEALKPLEKVQEEEKPQEKVQENKPEKEEEEKEKKTEETSTEKTEL